MQQPALDKMSALRDLTTDDVFEDPPGIFFIPTFVHWPRVTNDLDFTMGSIINKKIFQGNSFPRYFVLLVSLMLGLCRWAAVSAGERCDALRAIDLSGIQDALTQILEVKQFDGDDDLPSYCQVSGYVAPRIEFVLRFPVDDWNGKLLELGCGGYCGSTGHIVGCTGPLRRGYACIVNDGGHKGFDGKWAYNDIRAKVDLAYRAPHVTALAGKAVIERYYNRPPKYSYFMGCSGGGSQAMWMAQRFPWDFDGIVAGAPDIRWSESNMTMLWGNRVLTGHSRTPFLSHEDIELLHGAVVKKCDLNDGIADGLIGDPRQCNFNPAELLCQTGKEARCLSAQKIDIVRKIYSGPMTSKGEPLFMPYALKGSERSWLPFFWGSESNPQAIYDFMAETFRYLSFSPDPGPAWRPKDFDFDLDHKRLGLMESLTEPTNPDLRKFRAAGGKLLAYTGWADPAEGVLRTIDYYENAEKIAGGRVATEGFFRLFVVPGMGHCSGGDGPHAIDYLSYLEAWVENGKAPDKLIGGHPKDFVTNVEFPMDPKGIEFSRPIYPYPAVAGYSGHGDPSDASNFRPLRR